MTPLDTALRRVAEELARSRVPFALVGGLAVSVRTEPRFTRDADLAVALATDAEAEALIHALRARGFGIGAIVEQEAVGRLATVRLTFSREPRVPVVDLLFASSGIEAEVVADASALQQFDSSALAILLECRRQALAEGKTFAVLGAPQRLLQLAGVYGVAELIPAAGPVSPAP